MPVVGHTFVGLATAVQFAPAARRDGRALGALAVASWTPLVVAISYFPDLITQLGGTIGWRQCSLFGHSMPIGAVVGAAIGWLWARATGASAPRLIAVSIGAILGHDILDLLQATDRAPFWPLSNRMITAGAAVLPTRASSEALLFAFLFALFAIWRLASRRPMSPFAGHAALARRPALVWLTRAAVAALVLAALFTHALRSRRERQLDAAHTMLERGEYAAALRAADIADGWPAPSGPGRIDVLRGEAYEAIGDTARAETFYLRGYEADPTNFWAVADLAEYYASSDRPLDERQRLARRYLDDLQARFRNDRHLAQIVKRIERKLRAS